MDRSTAIRPSTGPQYSDQGLKGTIFGVFGQIGPQHSEDL
jgi:hypothetical protein